jgi:hypothetical protein
MKNWLKGMYDWIFKMDLTVLLIGVIVVVKYFI